MTIQEIEYIICKDRGIKPSYLHVQSRKRELRETRQIIMYFALLNKCGTQAKIGGYFGRDHASAIHSRKVVNNMIETNKEFAQTIEYYKRKLEISFGHTSLDDLEKDISIISNRLVYLKKLREDIIQNSIYS